MGRDIFHSKHSKVAQSNASSLNISSDGSFTTFLATCSSVSPVLVSHILINFFLLSSLHLLPFTNGRQKSQRLRFSLCPLSCLILPAWMNESFLSLKRLSEIQNSSSVPETECVYQLFLHLIAEIYPCEM